MLKPLLEDYNRLVFNFDFNGFPVLGSIEAFASTPKDSVFRGSSVFKITHIYSTDERLNYGLTHIPQGCFLIKIGNAWELYEKHQDGLIPLNTPYFILLRRHAIDRYLRTMREDNLSYDAALLH